MATSTEVTLNERVVKPAVVETEVTLKMPLHEALYVIACVGRHAPNWHGVKSSPFNTLVDALGIDFLNMIGDERSAEVSRITQSIRRRETQKR